MKSIYLFLSAMLLINTSCSNNDDVSSEVVSEDEYFNLDVGGIKLPLAIRNSYEYNSGGINQIGDDLFLLYANYGFGSSSEQTHNLKIYFDKTGGTINVHQVSHGINSPGFFNYRNYENYPSNYFNITIISLDEVNKRIKLNFSGKLYLNETNMNSESIDINGNLDIFYGVGDSPYYGIVVYGIEQYCSANFNNNQWVARNEKYLSAFTASDPYRIELFFANAAPVGSYNFNPLSSENYVRLSKFNTSTLNYDYYNCTGVASYSYKEFHGLTRYSFIGTFNFIAVNPNDPSDIIQVTEGVFRSYQQY